MKKTIFFYALPLLILAGCGHQTDEQVLDEAVNSYSAIAGKYHAIIKSEDNKEVVKNCKRLGRDFRTNSWWYSASLDIAEIAPLHRASYLIADDIKDISHILRKLEGRMLTTVTIYEKFNSLLDNLNYTLNTIRDTNSYVEEARILEQRRIDEERLYEARRQRYALEAIASQPVVIESTRVVKNKIVHERCCPKTCEFDSSYCGPKKCLGEIEVE